MSETKKDEFVDEFETDMTDGKAAQEERPEVGAEDIASARTADEFDAAAAEDPLGDTPDEFAEDLGDVTLEELDEFDSTVNFEKFIVLSKKDLLNFCRVVEPLTKASVDEYGKCVMIRCIDKDSVELLYTNAPSNVAMKVPNKSGKTMKPFAMTVVNLKKLATGAYASLILVEENDEIHFALGTDLLYVETKPLKEINYNFKRKNTPATIDKALSSYVFKKVGSILSSATSAQEKVIVIKNNHALFNTGFFSAKARSPFGESQDFIMYFSMANLLATLSDISKVDIHYGIEEPVMALNCDGLIYVEIPIGISDKVKEFYSPQAENSLKFTPSIGVVNDALLRILLMVKTLDYLSDIVTIGFTKENMTFAISTQNQSKHYHYKFAIIEGAPEVVGEMKVSADIIKNYFDITGNDVKYAFTEEGLGIENEQGRFLVRKS